MRIKGSEFLDMSIEEQLDCFFADTFISHTKSHKCIRFYVVMECYEEWCDATGCAPLASPHKMGRHLADRYFKKYVDGVKLWFMEVRPDLLEE